jgi:hypothetical protein
MTDGILLKELEYGHFHGEHEQRGFCGGKTLTRTCAREGGDDLPDTSPLRALNFPETARLGGTAERVQKLGRLTSELLLSQQLGAM